MAKRDSTIKLLDAVALTVECAREEVATRPGRHRRRRLVAEVEFSDDEGRAYAQASLENDQLLVLHYHPGRAAVIENEIAEATRIKTNAR